jgi:hypothetical protein
MVMSVDVPAWLRQPIRHELVGLGEAELSKPER